MTTEQILEDIKELSRHYPAIQAVILFGSVARGQERQESDIDLCFILKNPGEQQDIQNKLLALEKKYDKNINVILTNTTFESLDRHLIETLLREGVLLQGSFPEIPIKQLELEPYEIFKFDLSNISQSEKMKIKRLLYGITTKKQYHEKIYENKQQGLVDELGGIRIGIASLLIPEKASWQVEETLRRYKIPLRKITIWLSKP